MTAAQRSRAARIVAVALSVLLLAATLGGQALLGRIDPALALPVLIPPCLLLAWWMRDATARDRRRAPVVVLLLLIVGQGALALLLAHRLPVAQLAAVAVAGAFAAGLAGLVVRLPLRRFGRAGAALLLALLWFGAAHGVLAWLYRPPVAPPGAPAATMLTGLPLRWGGGGDIAAMIADGAADDPALARLEAMGPVELVDSLADPMPVSGAALLIAHPRALAPRDLVALDAFVRGGGRAVILADALSGWPPPHPLGDPRNPPVTSLLTPLFDHWGITLGAAPASETAPLAVDVAGARLMLFSAGRFDRLPPACRGWGEARVLRCRVGQGTAWIVGDADLLFAPLWRPPLPWAHHLRRSDAMDWLGERLWGSPATAGPRFAPVWIAVGGH